MTFTQASRAASILAFASVVSAGCSSSDFAVAGPDDDSGVSPDTQSAIDALSDVGDTRSSRDASTEASSDAPGDAAVDTTLETSADAATDGGLAKAVGCSDLTREYLTDMTMFPEVAACSGGFTLPGLGPDATGGCGHLAGNDSTNANGTGCHASDLCAVGWHICADNVEFQLKSSVSKCPEASLPTKAFFASGQRSSSAGVCAPDPPAVAANDLFGCGSLGDSTSCGSLNRTLSTFTTDTASWSLGTDNDHERDNVVKSRANGGVLCCAP